MKIYPILKVLMLSLIVCNVINARADETTAMLSLTIGDQRVQQGDLLSNDLDFTKAKFSIVDAEGLIQEKFKIIDGNVVPVSIATAKTGAVLPNGELDAKAITLIQSAKGTRINFTIRTHFGPNLLERTWKFHFYIEVEPTLVFGSIKNGDENVELAMLKELRTVQVLFVENPTLVKFQVVKGMLTVNGLQGTGPILQSGQLHQEAIRLINSAKGREVTLTVLCKDPNGNEQKISLVFKVAA